MFDLRTLQKYDANKMYKIYDKWPEISKESYEIKHGQIDFKNINNIVFAGMGGSGTIGDILSSILSKSKIHVQVVKGYVLPKTIDSNTLVAAISVSGNTLETLSVLKSAKKNQAKIITFSSGGKMLAFCKNNKIEHRNISQIHSPRASLTTFLYSILKVLEPVLPIEKYEIMESIKHLERLRKIISSSNLASSNTSISLAEYITDIPLIYYPYGLQAAAIRFKNSLQENAKVHAIAEDVIESSHNGIVAWEKPSKIKPILVQGQDDHVNTKERWKILREYFEENNIDYKEVHSIKGGIFSKIINLIYLLDYTTIYLAVLSKTNPSPVRSIDFIKNKLK